MKKDWIQTLKGKPCFPVALTPEMVDLRDIPVALARRKRFSGQTVEFLNGSEVEGYSVAQHTELGSRLIAPHFALAFLLHEVSEVYLPDVPKPIKPILFVDVAAGIEHYGPELLQHIEMLPDGRALATWETLEAQHAGAMLAALKLSSLLPLLTCPEVKLMDAEMLAAEKKFLMGPEPMPWRLPFEPHAGANEFNLCPRSEFQAKRDWLERFRQLTGRLPEEMPLPTAHQATPAPPPGWCSPDDTHP